MLVRKNRIESAWETVSLYVCCHKSISRRKHVSYRFLKSAAAGGRAPGCAPIGYVRFWFRIPPPPHCLFLALCRLNLFLSPMRLCFFFLLLCDNLNVRQARPPAGGLFFPARIYFRRWTALSDFRRSRPPSVSGQTSDETASVFGPVRPIEKPRHQDEDLRSSPWRPEDGPGSRVRVL